MNRQSIFVDSKLPTQVHWFQQALLCNSRFILRRSLGCLPTHGPITDRMQTPIGSARVTRSGIPAGDYGGYQRAPGSRVRARLSLVPRARIMGPFRLRFGRGLLARLPRNLRARLLCRSPALARLLAVGPSFTPENCARADGRARTHGQTLKEPGPAKFGFWQGLKLFCHPSPEIPNLLRRGSPASR